MRIERGAGRSTLTTQHEALAAFDETLRKSPATGGWTSVVWPRSAVFFETRVHVVVLERLG